MRDMRLLREVFDDWLMRAAGVTFLVTVVVVLFNVFSDLIEQHPLFGVLMFAMVPVLFVVGGVVFVMAILRS